MIKKHHLHFMYISYIKVHIDKILNSINPFYTEFIIRMSIMIRRRLARCENKVGISFGDIYARELADNYYRFSEPRLSPRWPRGPPVARRRTVGLLFFTMLPVALRIEIDTPMERFEREKINLNRLLFLIIVEKMCSI